MVISIHLPLSPNEEVLGEAEAYTYKLIVSVFTPSPNDIHINATKMRRIASTDDLLKCVFQKEVGLIETDETTC